MMNSQNNDASSSAAGMSLAAGSLLDFDCSNLLQDFVSRGSLSLAARRESLAMAARRESLASLSFAARRESLSFTARRESLSFAARRASLAMGARRGSLGPSSFLDFQFFPVMEPASTAVNTAYVSTSRDMSKLSLDSYMIAANQSQQLPALIKQQQEQQRQLQQLQLQQLQLQQLQQAPYASTVFHSYTSTNDPVVTTVSLDTSSSDDSVVSKDITSPSGDDGTGHRFKPFHEEKWTLRYRELLEFRRETGHSAVPHTYPKNPQLARWIKRQRRQHKLMNEGKPSTMTTERLELLNSVGFIWDSHHLNWLEKLEALRAFKQEIGHCNVPSNFRDKKLSTWVKCQRRQYKLYRAGRPSAMSVDRIAALEKVGFEWEIRSSGSKLAKATVEPAAVASSQQQPEVAAPTDPRPVNVSSVSDNISDEMQLARGIFLYNTE